jgi:antitoxin ParD1/3/4
MGRRTVHLTLREDLDAEVAAAVAGGEYASAEEAIAGAVAEWRASRQLDGEALRRLWREGVESGSGRNMSIAEIKEEARRRMTRE